MKRVQYQHYQNLRTYKKNYSKSVHSLQVVREHHQTTHRIPATEETVPVTVSSSTSISTTTTEHITQPSTTTKTTTTTTTTTTPATTILPEEPRMNPNKQKQVNEYEDYNYENYDDEDDNAEDPVESETVIPVFSKKQNTIPKFGESEITTESGTTTKSTTTEETLVENIPVTVQVPMNTTATSTMSTTASTTTTTEQSTTPQIIVETEPEVCHSILTCFQIVSNLHIPGCLHHRNGTSTVHIRGHNVATDNTNFHCGYCGDIPCIIINDHHNYNRSTHN